MSKHTPGPWEVRRSGVTVGTVNIGPPGHNVARSSQYGEVARANAKLLAAAPEMLAALKGAQALLVAMGVNPQNSDYLSITAAINKAEAQ